MILENGVTTASGRYCCIRFAPSGFMECNHTCEGYSHRSGMLPEQVFHNLLSFRFVLKDQYYRRWLIHETIIFSGHEMWSILQTHLSYTRLYSIQLAILTLLRKSDSIEQEM
jgi:hypothetical protein